MKYYFILLIYVFCSCHNDITIELTEDIPLGVWVLKNSTNDIKNEYKEIYISKDTIEIFSENVMPYKKFILYFKDSLQIGNEKYKCNYSSSTVFVLTDKNGQENKFVKSSMSETKRNAFIYRSLLQRSSNDSSLNIMDEVGIK